MGSPPPMAVSDHRAQPPGGSTAPSPLSSWSKKLPDLPPSEQAKPFFLLDNGVARVSIPYDIVDEGSPLWERFVVGYFMGDAPHVGTIHATVNRIWRPAGSQSRVDVQFLNPTTVLFRFDNFASRERVLKRRYWHLADVPFVVNEWRPETANIRPDLSAMPLWVDLKDVPGYLYSQKGLRYLGDITGNFIRLHPNTERCTRLDMARVLVEVDLTKPMTEKICITDKQGGEVSIVVSYPWLPPRCSDCSKWGHKAVDCGFSNPKSILTRQQGTVIQSEVTRPIAVTAPECTIVETVQGLLLDLDQLHAKPAGSGV